MVYQQFTTSFLIDFNQSPPCWVVIVTLLVFVAFAIRGFRRAARAIEEQDD